jgi:YVTN family beta-propeller protein
MIRAKYFIILMFLAFVRFPLTTVAQVPTSAYVNFEGAQTNPVRLSPDGDRLFAVNTPDAKLSVFDITQPTNPVLLSEIPVGIEPVSVNARTNDEVWVVNQVSDSISVVSVSRKIVIDTISVKDEPADVVFAGKNLAFVTAARSNTVSVFNATKHTRVASIRVLGNNPRALAVSSDGTKVYAAFALSGNGTTIIPAQDAPPQPPPTNPDLPPAPQVGLIVAANDPAWSAGVIKYAMPDNDVVEIDATTLAVSRYFSRVGTINLGIAVQPVTGDLFVANTESLNLTRFEPALRGHFVDNRITRIEGVQNANGALIVTPFDLNREVDYFALPNPSARGTALAQPAALVFHPDGGSLYVAAFGTDRVARISTDGNVISRIDIGPATGSTVDPRRKRGPRGLALNAATWHLYVLNRISSTMAVIDISTDQVVKEVPVGKFDPTPLAVRNGRGFLYDAKLSGNGTASCASCHIDADMDHLAWDIGDPAGSMQTVVDQSFTFQMHPMKGPMTTQTLRGLSNQEPYHWRGDRADFLAFNHAFDSLLGGQELSAEDMTAFRDFINTLRFQPNPNQKLDRTLPPSFAGGDPNAGRNTFMNEPFTDNVTCNSCHTADPGTGTDRRIFPASQMQDAPGIKVPHLRNIYQKLNFNNAPGASSISGFGLLHDGSSPNLLAFLSLPVFQLFANDTTRKKNLNAFMQCFDTGMAPAVGYSRTLTASNVSDTATANDWTLLEKQAAAGNVDLIVKGTVNGQRRGLLYRPSSRDYVTDKVGVGPFTRAKLKSKIAAGDILTIMGVPPGSGRRMGIDRNLDGILDGG